MPKLEKYAQGTPSYAELVTPDQQSAKAFYASLFGWELEDVPMGDMGIYVTVSKDGAAVAGISGPMPGMEDHPAWWGVYLTVDDVDAVTAKVAAAGGRVDAEPFDVFDMGRMSSIADPTGARVNLWQPGTSIGTELANEPGTPIWNEVLTTDVDRATAFYADVLGVSWEAMGVEGAPPYTCLMVEGRPVGGAMALGPEMEGVPPHWNVYFNVESTDDTVARATELGGTVVAPAFDVPTVGRLAVLADPQGGMFCLMQNPD
ncbi:VOC family protein [Nocardioides sp. MAH-18]|uniref:VOC family protein n=1 Tax=Nocardioides agri TaxID=2682843 RepID=A0A6L6XS64_9ACTN|nr:MULTISPECIES: VOC family protein [unclassified Nocardioides]MBA2955177.1 VOC family protein [Nocardioides sp. CGMCC 1.13656]MVQ50030.1 VOC family protein [Nocardioides sp. MAH-18]